MRTSDFLAALAVIFILMGIAIDVIFLWVALIIIILLIGSYYNN